MFAGMSGKASETRFGRKECADSGLYVYDGRMINNLLIMYN